MLISLDCLRRISSGIRGNIQGWFRQSHTDPRRLETLKCIFHLSQVWSWYEYIGKLMAGSAKIIETVFRDLKCFNNHHDHKEEKHEPSEEQSSAACPLNNDWPWLIVTKKILNISCVQHKTFQILNQIISQSYSFIPNVHHIVWSISSERESYCAHD